MSFTVAPTQQDIFAAVQAFIMGILPLDLAHVIQGNENRVPMPQGPFVLMNIVTMTRLRTNLITWDADQNMTHEQGLQAEMQLDVYGPDAGDWANMLTTLWRDEYGCDALAPNCQPLYADVATQAPLVNGEDQYENRFIIRAQLQYNPIVSVVTPSATVVEIDVISVDVTYPPT